MGKRSRKAPAGPLEPLRRRRLCWSSSPGKKRHGPSGGLYEGLRTRRRVETAEMAPVSGTKSLTAKGLSKMDFLGPSGNNLGRTMVASLGR